LQSPRQKHHLWITVALSGLLIAACYGFALKLPFFFDDLPVMTWLGWHNLTEIWTQSSEGAYYRPLSFSIYELGLLLPSGARAFALHAVNLLLFWTNTVLVAQIVTMCDREPAHALLSAVLFAVFPFVAHAIPWITALPHPLVASLTLLAAYAALRAEHEDKAWWWSVSLAGTVLAPFAHESGYVCSVIVGGLVLIQYGVRGGRRRLAAVILGGALNLAALWLRGRIPGVAGARLIGWQDRGQNLMFFLHSLLYPIAPVIGRLVFQHGGHDFTLIKVATAGLAILLVWLLYRNKDWRTPASCLWWWICGALPAALSFRYRDLYVAPRLYALASAGIVILWAYVIIEVGRTMRHLWIRRLIWAVLVGAIVVQNITFLHRQGGLFEQLNNVYQQVLEAAKDKRNAPLGFVNLPASLAWPERVYPLIQETVIFVPWYSNVQEFIGVNAAPREAHAVMYPPVLQEAEQIYDFQGPGLDWEQMRQFAIDHASVWLTRYVDGRVFLLDVGTITTQATPLPDEPLAQFENGPKIEFATTRPIQDGHWAIEITWLASGPVDGEVFLHVKDASGNLVAQADGPALGGMVPIWLWQPGDRIHDVRHVTLPQGGGPYSVQVGIYDREGRFPVFVRGVRCPDDAAPIVNIIPSSP
jgi:hypothetical protein